jgi:uncharacterized protein YaiE (UPF0345 family)
LPIPNPTTSWQTYTGSITSGGWDSHTVDLVAAAEYTFKTGCGDGATASFDTVIEVRDWDNDCALIACNDDGCESYRTKVTLAVEATGTYNIKIRGYDADEFTDYTLRYRRNPVDSPEVPCCTGTCSCPAGALPIPNPTTSWQTYNGSITSGGWDSHTVDLVAAAEYTFKTGCGDGATASFDTVIEVRDWDNDCALIACNDDDCDSYRSKVTLSVEATGTYNIKIRGYDADEFTDYTLRYRREP